MAPIKKVLVVGATGATGKHVVRMLLDKGDTTVVAVARSKEKLLSLLKIEDGKIEPNLVVREVAISDLGSDDFKELTEGCGAIVSCLGHNVTFRGMYKDGLFLQNTVQELTKNMPEGCRFVLMGSDGVANPDRVSDPKRSRFERGIMVLLRWLVPPHVDNEKSALYLYQNPSFDWTIVRPGDLYNTEEGEAVGSGEKGYEIFDHPIGSLFGDNSTARRDVADFMVIVATSDPNTWAEVYNHKMPVIYKKKEKESQEQHSVDSKKTK